MGSFPLRALGCGVAQTRGAAAHPATRAPGGCGRTPAVGGVDSAPTAASLGTPLGRRASVLGYWRAPGARRGMVPVAPQATSAPSRSTSWRIPPTRWPSPGARVSAAQAMPPWAPRNLRYDEMIRPGWPAGLQSPGGSIHEPPQSSRGEPPGPILQTVTPSSPEASLPSARPAGPCDPEASRVPQHCPPPALAGAPMGTLGCSRPDSLLSPRLPKQVTLSTLSRPRFGLSHFYLRVHPEKEGGKNPEEIRVNWKEKISKGCPQRRKSPDSADLQTTTRLSGGRRETASHPDPTRNPAPSATFPLLQAERTPLYHQRPPSWRWANTQALNGHRRPASGSPFYTQSSQYLRSYPCGKTLARQLFPAPIPTAYNRLHSLLWSVSHPTSLVPPQTPFSRSCLSSWENSMGDEIKMKTCPPV